LFNKRCDSQKLDRTDEFLRLAGRLYDPNNPIENENEDQDQDQEEVEPEEDLEFESLDF